ncbi:hypothetical protein DPSP01_008652 [Paraphaeosphaeria sporulosa]
MAWIESMVGDAPPPVDAVAITDSMTVGFVNNKLREPEVVSTSVCESVGNASVAVKVVDGDALIVRPRLVSLTGSKSLYGAASMEKLGMSKSWHHGGSPGIHFCAAMQHQPFPQSTGEKPQVCPIERFAV